MSDDSAENLVKAIEQMERASEDCGYYAGYYAEPPDETINSHLRTAKAQKAEAWKIIKTELAAKDAVIAKMIEAVPIQAEDPLFRKHIRITACGIISNVGSLCRDIKSKLQSIAKGEER